MERFFQILAVILIAIAAFFLWKNNGDGAFIAAVLGAVSFFLSVRFQVRERLKKRENFNADAQKQRDFKENSAPE